MNDTFFPFLIDFYRNIPDIHCHLSRESENCSHDYCRVENSLVSKVKVDEAGSIFLKVLTEKFALFGFGM